MLSATLYADPGCPWGYSASPALAVLRWRYGSQIDWRLVLIGLSESAERYVEMGYTPARATAGMLHFRDRYGMPFTPAPRERMFPTSPACRAVVAARRLAPGSEWSALRALQLAWFNSPLLLDEPAGLEQVLSGVEGLDARTAASQIDDPEVLALYQADRAEARTAAGTPTEFQGKSAQSDGPVRYTAPSVVLTDGDRRLEAGGFQPIEAYDVLVANLDPTLERREAPESPLPALREAPDGLVTQEVAAILARGNDAPDRRAAEAELVALAAEGSVRRVSLGDDALWLAA